MSSPDPHFPITAAQLVGNFCETLTYGMYIVSCFFCAQALLFIGSGREERWRKPREIRWFLVSVGLALFLVSSFDVAIGLYHNIHAFVQYKGPGGAAASLTDISDWVNISRSVAQVINMILGDFVLIYRCWIVYARRWKFVLPSFILYLGGVAMAIKLIQEEGSLNHRAILLNSSEIKPWWTAFFAITMVQNVLTTGLLIWRIWRVDKQTERYRTPPANVGVSSGRSGVSVTSTLPATTHQLRRVIRVIAESGFGYTLLVFMTFVVSLCNSNALYPTSDATLQATGIAFNVIIARTTSRSDEQFESYDRRMGTEHRPSGSYDAELRSMGAGGKGMMPTNGWVGRKSGLHGSGVTAKPMNVQVSFKTEREVYMDMPYDGTDRIISLEK